MSLDKLCLLKTCLIGFAHVFFQVAVVSVLMVWGMQVLAGLHGVQCDWAAILQHVFLSLSFLAFFPGQSVWTFRMRGPHGRMLTIVGQDRPTDQGGA